MEKTAIKKEVKAICIELEAMAASVGSAHAGRPRAAVDTIVKLEKLKCPKFSGIPRDFGQFVRDFNQIVNIPGRSDVKVGSNLMDAIPEKYKHLVSHLETMNHREMMNVLDRKFGTKNLVINNIIGQLEKMKIVTNDKMLLDFVEKLQKMKLDLDSLRQTSEIANVACMGKIEERLLSSVSTDWWKMAV